MMNKRIRSMVDEIFSEMKMTAENLALRDELMANAQARYEDSVAQGKSEEEKRASWSVPSSLRRVMAVVLRSSSPSYLPLAATKVLYSGMLKESIDHSPRPVPSLASLTMGSTAFLKHCLLRSPVRGSCFSRCSAAAASRRLLIMRARQPQIMGSTDMPMSVRSSAGSQMPAKPMRLPSMESGLMTT